MKPRILVHGGADTALEGTAKKGVIRAASTGIKYTDSALDMVQEAIKVLEDDGSFGAGAGSRLGVDGKVSQTANIMDGKTLDSGAVILLSGIKNPILAARKVMTETDNRILAGEFATKFAQAFNLPESEKVSGPRRAEFEKLREQLKLSEDLDYLVKWPRLRELIRSKPGLFGMDTVGAIAIDRRGNFAVAGSSGGLTLQLPGRINDLAIIGAGLLADNKAGGVCVTGLGEFSIKYGVARDICGLMAQGISPSEATSRWVGVAAEERVPYGAIAINKKGEWGVDWNSLPVMAHCFLSEDGEPEFVTKAKSVRIS